MFTMLIGHSSQYTVVRRLNELLRARFGFCEPAVVSLLQAETYFIKEKPDLAILVLMPEQAEKCLDVIRRLRGIGGGHLLVVGPATDPKTILKAMQVGADLFLDQDELESEFESALLRLGSPQGPRTKTGELVAFLSTAGGCGASTLAVNAAALLARETGKCNLIDMNPGRADLGPLLDLKPLYTTADLCRNEDRLDASMFQKLLTEHSSGVSLLAAPQDYEELPVINPRGIGRAVTIARQSFEHVVVDLADCFRDEQLIVLEQATRIVLVCRLDFTAIRGARNILDRLAARTVPIEKIVLVVNQSGLPNELPAAEAETAVRMKLSHFIPHEPGAFGEATNTGVPAVIKNGQTQVAQRIAKLVGLEVAAPTAPPLARLQNWLRQGVGGRFRAAARGPQPQPHPPLARVAALTPEDTVSHESSPLHRSALESRACPA